MAMFDQADFHVQENINSIIQTPEGNVEDVDLVADEELLKL